VGNCRSQGVTANPLPCQYFEVINGDFETYSQQITRTIRINPENEINACGPIEGGKSRRIKSNNSSFIIAVLDK